MFRFYVYQHTIGPYIYIGKGTGNRINLHDHHSRSAKYRNAFRKYGCTAEVLAYFATEDAAYEYEALKIAEVRTDGLRLLNLTDGGSGIRSYRHSDDAKNRMSLNRTGPKNHFFGKQHSEETKNKIRSKRIGQPSAMKGKRHSEETKAKLRLTNGGPNNPRYGKTSAMKGKEHSEETRRKMSVAHSGANNHFYGKTHSTETRQRLSDKLKGRVAPNKGKPFSEAARMKMSEAAKRRCRSRNSLIPHESA